MELQILQNIQALLSNDFLDQFFVTYSRLGNTGEIWIAIIILLLFFKKTRKLAILMAISLAIEFVLNDLVLKPLIARPRPFEVYEVALILEAPTSYAFPSGHSASAFAVVMVAYFRNHEFKVPLIIMAAIMAFSRLYLFVHWPTDVLAGILFGTLIAYLVVKLVPRYVPALSDHHQINT